MRKIVSIGMIIVIVLLVAWSVNDYIKNKDTSSKQDDFEGGLIVAYPDDEGKSEGEYNGIGLERDKPAPDFELENLDGEDVKLSDYLGEKVIVNFWATWCAPCREEIPDFIKLYEEVDDVEILAVNMTASETSSMEEIEAFALEKFEMPFPVLLDEADHTTELYRIAAYPTSYIIDSEGVIRHMAMGAMTYDDMKKELQKIN